MTYKKLSELLNEYPQAQHIGTLHKAFLAAVREGQVDATYTGERFSLPKVFRRRNAAETYQREVREMIFEVTPQFEAWFKKATHQLETKRVRKERVKPTAEAIESGEFDFKAAVEATRNKMKNSFDRGQKLGQTKAKARHKK